LCEISTPRSKIFSSFLFSLKLIWKIRKVIRNKEIHILHANSRVSATFLRIFFPNIPLIFTEHNWDVLSAPFGYTTSSIFHFSLLFFELFALNYSSGIICLSQNSCERIKFFIKHSSKRIFRLPNLLNEEIRKNNLSHSLEEQLSNERYLLCIGRLEKEKNLEFLIEAFGKAFKEKSRLKLYIIGKGSRYNYLKELIIRYDFDDQVEILSKVPNRDKNAFIKHCEFLISASLFEIMPTVILEAYSYKKPVIASNIGPHRELIVDKSTGYLFNPNNISELIELLRIINHKNNKSDLLGNNAYQFFKEHYSSEEIITRLIKIYEKFNR
jgi:glycosyltransferase involved in cell wall biosynthesis